ncbi:MAG: peptidoglycan DD-metalloendopeptidase family protein [Saprospiraceae bacterium]|nr:peptidoglycan DD-metalloendopeptidase family protein [Saprospiraceae bacterium]MDW8485145.1 peptidoglycan DD-metalloendopeptidase family protein [Saprospiraceae bacterium]
MGRKETFVYNTQTLSYEKVVTPIRTRILRAFGFLSAVIVTAIGLLALLYHHFPSPREKELLAEIEQMERKFAQLNEEMNEMSNLLQRIQERDAYVHRAIFGMDPIDPDVWKAGTGGHEVHPEAKAFKYGGDVIQRTLNQMDVLRQQLLLQARSLDTIMALAKDQQKMLASIPSIKPVREDKLQKSLNVLSGFGYRIHPVYKIRKFHQGVDFPARIGTPVQATGDGVVVEAGWHQGYGNCVRINHGYGYETWYAHLHRMSVRAGERVKKGQKIGEVGDTGLSTAPHLHYEVHYKGKPINPIHFCMDNLTPQEYQELVNRASIANQSLD